MLVFQQGDSGNTLWQFSSYRLPCHSKALLNFGMVNFEILGDKIAGKLVVMHYENFGFINGVDNVNWPPYRDSKS